MKSWKTTSTGIAMIVGGVVRFIFAYQAGNFTEESIMTTVTAILGGIGFLFSKDNNVTGGTRER